MGANMGKNTSLLDALPSGQGTLHVVMLGLDSAGKTTALYRLKFDQYLNTVPTIGFNCEKVKGMIGKAKGINFLVWDVGGQEKLRPLWKSYTRCTDGIVFVLDSVDVERMEEAKMELIRTVKSPENTGVPILVLANKQDLPGAREPRDLEKLLGLTELGGGSSGGHLWHVQPACAITGDGLHEGLEVLYEMILKRRKLAKMCKKKTSFTA
ncbi:PREDICTED: ADP-ribosylation factor-like protein 4A [Nicrophorus vespilloides]|uniref:ADP-ribosylation factor-like protein 4A n=1 Tax=Nicrophorus vespilloides TaxID=110193 RepID=A0ABM1MGH2_NICVS|nr:PREDICTED: ADP-ribosylation factor-like protein 4A [Nicrophorus vespilloides]XP_017773673.1 PREDICTED: ADP-ribosylation factor-like protein 4A [Nicrophorus vespilloides]XP_017773674.1 PREDICTED: ADP-ribosylation factor-like protein 4A [Nicrophorus vespilloides]